MDTRSFFFWLGAVWVTATAEIASAQPAIPDALEPWRDWVLYGEEFRDCPLLSGAMPGERGAHICAWPGELALEVGAGGAVFRQVWRVAAADWLPLPGDAQLWPASVTLDGQPIAVVERDGRPALRVAAGRHVIDGRLTWSTRPASIPIPPPVGLVALTLDGTRVARPEIERGTLWLGREVQTAVEEDRLTVTVYRLIEDGIPVRAETEIQLDVAGSSREVVLAGALLSGFVGEALASSLPAQLDAAGTLRVQVRPGNWTLRIASHATALPETLAVPEAVEPWPSEEIWSFVADTRLRVAVLEGGEAIDSFASEVPSDWADYPSYRVVADATLDLVERSRNDADEPNRYSLVRDLWLDFAGGGFTALDRITGTLSSGWRLDMASPYTMTMATFDIENPDAANNLLITTRGTPGEQGIELRDSNVDIAATARIEQRGAAPVTGYRDPFDAVRTTLHLPPGHRLMAAPGADAVAGAWLNDWRLLDIFLALIVATAAWRLFGIGPGMLAGATLLLVMHEPFAPRWVWLNVLLAIGVLRVAPEGRLRRAATAYRAVSLAAAVLLLIPFTVTQLRTAVYPQLEQAALQRGLNDTGRLERFAADAAMTLERQDIPMSIPALRSPAELGEVIVTARRRESDLSRFLPGALLQAGPGLPDWSWSRATLRWTSPVGADQTYRLVIFDRWLLSAWRVTGVFAALWLLATFARGAMRLPRELLRGGSAAAAAIAALLLLAPPPGQAQPAVAEFPPPSLLEELKARLTEPEPCRPRCAELTRAAASVVDTALTLELEFANQAPVAAPLPGSQRGWHADTVAIDGVTASELFIGNDGRYWVALPEGVHTVRLSGVLPAATSVTVPFPLPPRTVTTNTPGWDVAGITDGRLLSGALELIRQQQDAEEETLGASEFAPYVGITRVFQMGLEWSVFTRIERVAPDNAAFSLAMPLLENEAVLSPEIEIANGVATIAFAAGQDETDWSSRLPGVTSLELTAATDARWTETWIFDVGPLWHVEIDGVPRTPTADNIYVFEYSPRPGETLAVELSRPTPAGGDTIAIDSVDYSVDVGQRLAQSHIEFTYRSTRAEQHVVTLPEGSTLDRVTMDGDELALRLDGRNLELPVTTGEHDVTIAWRIERDMGVRTSLDPVDLGVGASNLRLSLQLPGDRWVLWGFGPTLGSAVLYWSELLVFVVIALALGRLRASPLRTHEWLLLGLGLSTFAWPTLVLFAVWAFAMSWRATTEHALPDRAFNATQFGLGLLSFVALVSLIAAIPTGLLGAPDMQIVSPVGFGRLSWFADRSDGVTPSAGAISASLWFYRAAMLAWALWLSFTLLRWLPWAWQAFNRGGLWRGKVATQS